MKENAYFNIVTKGGTDYKTKILSIEKSLIQDEHILTVNFIENDKQKSLLAESIQSISYHYDSDNIK